MSRGAVVSLAVVSLAVALCLAQRAAWAADVAGPEIFEITPDEAAAGDVVRITGDRLSDTRDVVFCVGSTTKLASFEVVSDRELDVVVPNYFLPGKSAVIVVITPGGAAAAMPPTVVTVDGSRRQHPQAAPFYHVLKGGILRVAGGVTVVESEGTLSEATRTGLVLLKKNALLVKYANPAGLVLSEPGALFGESFMQNVNNTDEPFVMRVPVRSISTSVGIEPFLFKAPPQAEGHATGPPQIHAISPPAATYSSLIKLRGRGFIGTKEVWFCNGTHVEGEPAGFKAVSDTELDVVVPDVRAPYNWEFFIVVVNDEGATVTLPSRTRNYLSRSGLTPRGVSDGNYFYWQNAVECRKSSGGHLLWVSKGQVVDEEGGLVFVENGGRYAVGGAGQAFYEPGAILSESFKKSKSARGVPAIVPSTVPAMFTTLDLRLPAGRAALHAGEGHRLAPRKGKAKPPPAGRNRPAR